MEEILSGGIHIVWDCVHGYEKIDGLAYPLLFSFVPCCCSFACHFCCIYESFLTPFPSRHHIIALLLGPITFLRTALSLVFWNERLGKVHRCFTKLFFIMFLAYCSQNALIRLVPN